MEVPTKKSWGVQALLVRPPITVCEQSPNRKLLIKTSETLSDEAAAKVRSRGSVMGLVEKWIDAKSRGSREECRSSFDRFALVRTWC